MVMPKPKHNKVDVSDFAFPSGNTAVATDQSSAGGLAPAPAESATEKPDGPQTVLMLIDDIVESDLQTREREPGQGSNKFQRLVKSMQKTGPDHAIKVHMHPTLSGKYQVTAGGHSRLAAAKVAGLTHYPVVIVAYDQELAVLGTGWENLAREDLSPLEEGEYYLKARRYRGYNRDELAEAIGVPVDRIKECEALANSAEDIKDMIRRIKALEQGAERGLQAAKHLRRLDILEKQREGLAARLRAPLIDLFVYGRITTSEMDLATARLVRAEDPEAQLATLLQSIRQREESEEEGLEPDGVGTKQKDMALPKEPPLQRMTKLGLLTRNFRGFTQLLGDVPPSDEEKRILSDLRQQIDVLMSR
jgi:ParB/RepB/Spo0J family partition protein